MIFQPLALIWKPIPYASRKEIVAQWMGGPGRTLGGASAYQARIFLCTRFLGGLAPPVFHMDVIV